MNSVTRLSSVVLALCLAVPAASTVGAQGEAPQALQLSEQRHGTSPPLRDLPAWQAAPGVPSEMPLHRPHAPAAASFQSDPVLQTSAAAALGTTIDLNVLGLGVGFPAFSVQYAPPDTNLAVGKSQVVEWVNAAFAVFDKSGNRVLGPLAGNAPWTGFGGPCETNNDGDPVVQYDKAANQWVMTQVSFTGGPPFYQCVAVSKTSDATGQWYQYAFEVSAAPDYSKLAVWPDGYYLSTNLYSGNFFVGPLICALDRDNMRIGQAARGPVCFQLSTSYDSLLPSDLDGPTAPPPGAPNYVVSLGSNALNMWKFSVDWGTNPPTGTLAGPTSIAVAPFTQACNGGVCIPQPGTGQKLDSLGYALMYRAAYRNFPNDPNGARESIVLTHSVGSPSGVRWYELRQTAASDFSVYQQGTFGPTDGNNRWMGSVAMDQFGDIAVGYSVSSSNRYPSIAFTGCVPNATPPCTMGQETVITNGAGSQIQGLNRWGDYTSLSVDPVDDCTFWYVNEYLQRSGKFNWSTRIASFRFPSCPSPTPTPQPTATKTRTPTATSAVTSPTRTPTKKKGPRP